MYFNGSENVVLENGKVKLGHETNVVFEVVGIPSDMHSATIKNTVFNDIYKRQGALFVFKENFEKKQFIFNDANNHQLSLKVSDNEFVEVTKHEASTFSTTLLFGIIGVLGLGDLIQNIYKRRRIHLLKGC